MNAAVEGALEAGAQRVVVHDSHGLDYTNILADELHPSAELVKGMPVIFLDPDDLSTGDYSACLIVGAHARGGQAAVISHVLDWPRITEVRVNGIPVSESHLTVALAECYGIATTLVTGDNVICKEIEDWMGGQVETAVVKTSLSRYCARCLPLSESRALIRSAASRGLKNLKKPRQPRFSTPIRLEVDFVDRQAARYVSWMPQMSYDGCCTVSYEDGDYLRVYKTLVAMFAVANLL